MSQRFLIKFGLVMAILLLSYPLPASRYVLLCMCVAVYTCYEK